MHVAQAAVRRVRAAMRSSEVRSLLIGTRISVLLQQRGVIIVPQESTVEQALQVRHAVRTAGDMQKAGLSCASVLQACRQTVCMQVATCKCTCSVQVELIAAVCRVIHETSRCRGMLQILAEHRILSAPVTADGEVLGFVDIRDILAAFLRGAAVHQQACEPRQGCHRNQQRNPVVADAILKMYISVP